MGSLVAIDVVAKVTAFNARMGKVIRTMETVRRRMEGVSRAARRMLIAATAAATGAVVVFARFEQEMARVKGLTGATADEFKRLNQSARDLGKSTVFSATQAAQAMGAFALQGFETTEIIKAMPATLALAAAGQLGMGQAAAITAGIMKGMKLEAKDLTHVVDVLTVAATSSATDIPQLGQAMRAIGPVARAAGMSIEETVAIIRGMSDVMIQGSAAGIALRNVLLRLQKNSQEVKKRMDELGLSVADANGNMKDMPTIIDELNAALATKDQVTRSAIVTDIAGLRAAAAFTEILELGGDRIRQYTKELQDSQGAAKRLARIQRETLHGSFKLLTSAVSELAIKLGETFRPALQSATEAVKGIVEWFSKWESQTLKLTTAIGALGAAIVGIGLPIIIVTLAAIPAALKTIGAVLAWMKGLLVVSAAAVAGLAGGAALILGLTAPFAVFGRALAKLSIDTSKFIEVLGGVSRGFKEIDAAMTTPFEVGDTEAEIEALKRKARGLEMVAKEQEELVEIARTNVAQLDDKQAETLVLNARRNAEKARQQAQDIAKEIEEIESKAARRAERRRVSDAKRAAENAAAENVYTKAIEGTVEAMRKLIEKDNLRNNQAEIQRRALDKLTVAEWGRVKAIEWRQAREKREDQRRESAREKGSKESAAFLDQLSLAEAEAKAVKDSLLTDKERLAISIERLRVLHEEWGLITAIEFKDRVAALKDQDKPRSLAGQFEGLTDTFRRIQSSVAGGKTQSPAVAIRKQSEQQKQIAERKEARDQAHQKRLEGMTERMRDILEERLHPGFA